MRPIEQLYRDFCNRIAKTFEDEANLYPIQHCKTRTSNSFAFSETNANSGDGKLNRWTPLTAAEPRDNTRRLRSLV